MPYELNEVTDACAAAHTGTDSETYYWDAAKHLIRLGKIREAGQSLIASSKTLGPSPLGKSKKKVVHVNPDDWYKFVDLMAAYQAWLEEED